MASLSIECSDGEVVSVERDILLRASHVVKSKYGKYFSVCENFRFPISYSFLL